MNERIFAQGLCFEKLLWIFLIGAVLGDLSETVFCRIKMKKWMSRSSFVYGHFSIVWGTAMVIATVLFYKAELQDILNVFVTGIVLGGVYEYLCSLISEKCFGVVFWDYRKLPVNIGGRVNLKYCIYWGVASVLWSYLVFPFCENEIERIPIEVGTVISDMVFLLLGADACITLVALKRYVERNESGTREEISGNKFWSYIDRYFPDERMKKTYPCMKKK